MRLVYTSPMKLFVLLNLTLIAKHAKDNRAIKICAGFTHSLKKMY